MAKRGTQRLRPIDAPYVAPGPTGVAVRDRFKDLTPQDEQVLRTVGAHLGSLASRDLATRCRDGRDHDADTWATRKRQVSAESTSRWAGSITKATHDQWALARRSQAARLHKLEAGMRMLEHRLSLPLGAKGTRHAPGGYRSRREWHAKSRRLTCLTGQLDRERADFQAGRVRVVRGGKRLIKTRHHLEQAQLTKDEWRDRWEAERFFLQADGESGQERAQDDDEHDGSQHHRQQPALLAVVGEHAHDVLRSGDRGSGSHPNVQVRTVR